MWLGTPPVLAQWRMWLATALTNASSVGTTLLDAKHVSRVKIKHRCSCTSKLLLALARRAARCGLTGSSNRKRHLLLTRLLYCPANARTRLLRACSKCVIGLYPQYNILVICIGHGSGAYGFQIVNVLSAGCRRANEGRGQDGFANICIGTKYLVYTQILEKQRHLEGRRERRFALL